MEHTRVSARDRPGAREADTKEMRLLGLSPAALSLLCFLHRVEEFVDRVCLRVLSVLASGNCGAAPPTPPVPPRPTFSLPWSSTLAFLASCFLTSDAYTPFFVSNSS